MAEKRLPSGLGSTFLLGGMLVVIGVTLLLIVAPLSICPKCGGNGLTERLPLTEAQETMFRTNILDWKYRSVPCTYCLNKHKVSPLKRWRWDESDAPKPPIYRALP